MSESKKMSRKMRLAITSMTIGMYIAYVVLLFWYHPFVVSAKEATGNESIPGGSGNVITYASTTTYSDGKAKVISSVRIKAKEGYEIVGAKSSSVGGGYNPIYYDLPLRCVNLSSHKEAQFNSSTMEEFEVIEETYYDGKLQSRKVYSLDNIGFPFIMYYQNGLSPDYQIICEVEGIKIFDGFDAMKAYINSGSLDGMIKEPVLDKDWYLKNVDMIVTADDSPSSEAGEDATYVTFTWDTDNLQEGDLLEIKTHNYYKTLSGEEHGGFYDYITQGNNVSVYEGKYGPFSQYEVTKAWYKSLDYHPLFFKSYDTDIYFLRPIRNGKVGGWVKVSIKRNPLSMSHPLIDQVEYGDLDKDGNWTINKELTDKEGGYGTDLSGNRVYPSLDDSNNLFEGTTVSGIFKSFFDFFKDIPSLLGGLPGLVNSTIGFLPNWVIGFIAVGIVVVIILRIVGR